MEQLASLDRLRWRGAVALSLHLAASGVWPPEVERCEGDVDLEFLARRCDAALPDGWEWGDLPAAPEARWCARRLARRIEDEEVRMPSGLSCLFDDVDGPPVWGEHVVELQVC
jgi:hypothetical protein